MDIFKVNKINNNSTVNYEECEKYSKQHLIYYIRPTSIIIFILCSYVN